MITWIASMTHDSPAQGWMALTLLWVGSFIDGLFSAAGINIAVSVAVLVLTLLQILVSWRRLKKPISDPVTNWDSL